MRIFSLSVDFLHLSCKYSEATPGTYNNNGNGNYETPGAYPNEDVESNISAGTAVYNEPTSARDRIQPDSNYMGRGLAWNVDNVYG